MIGAACFHFEAGHGVAEIVVGEGGVGVDRAGQETATQRTERDEADAQFLQRRQQFALRLAPPQRVLALHCSHRLHGMGATHRGRTGFGQTEVAHLALGDQVTHGTGDVLDRHVRIYTVLVEQVDMVRAQALEAGFGHRADVLRATVQAGVDLGVLEAELGGDHQLVAVRRQRFAEQIFVGIRPVDFGGVEEGHAAFDRRMQQGDALALLDGGTVAMAQAHAAQAQGGDFQAAAAEFTCLHRRAPVGEQ
ncbi:hypothetical protein D3C72_1419570 [compost metagenome]